MPVDHSVWSATPLLCFENDISSESALEVCSFQNHVLFTRKIIKKEVFIFQIMNFDHILR